MSSSFSPTKFAEKYLLAQEAALKVNPKSGASGLELEWNILDADFKPVLTVGAGPDQQSFVDYLRTHCLPLWLVEYSQLEIFHWMIEWITHPYHSVVGAIYEARIIEAAHFNALSKAGRTFNEKLYSFHGNLLYPIKVGHDSIPGGHTLAKRRYLEHQVDQYGDVLAVSGIHTNLSLPEPLLSWDFMHLSPSERGEGHMDAYKNRVYVEATRLLRAFAPLFIAVTASTPMRPEMRDGQPTVILTDVDSNRNATFPNPDTLDIPNLYRSHEDYLRFSYDLVRRGLRMAGNDYMPVRARSSAEPVERLILATSDQLHALYHRGLYKVDGSLTVEEMARQIEREKTLARINIPMSRVEIRTDEGGHPLEVDIANLTLKELLLIQIYADPTFARAFRYDHEDIARARRNEAQAAQRGLRAEIENPFTGKVIGLRDFLKWTLDQLRPLAEGLELWNQLTPLVEMAAGAPNTAERMRARLQKEIGYSEIVPVELLKTLAVEREEQIKRDIQTIAASVSSLGDEAFKIRELLQRARDDVRLDPIAPIRFRPRAEAVLAQSYADKTSEVVDLAQQLIRIPSVTNCPEERLDEVHRAATLVFDYLRDSGLDVTYYNQSKYPAILAAFPNHVAAPVMLSGHFDVVPPEPDDAQFEPRVDGDYLWGRGSADMKTVVATYMVWMKDSLRAGPPYPNVNLLLIGNEENGEGEPTGTPHVLAELATAHQGYAPQLFIAGERTGEKGTELMGEVCIENRGILRMEIVARGAKGHTGVAGANADLSQQLIHARTALGEIFEKGLTLKGEKGWQSQYRFPFISVGQPGVYNITADRGILGIEIRSIPQDNLEELNEKVRFYCDRNGLELSLVVNESGIACDPSNPYLLKLLDAVRETFKQEPNVGKKLPGTSARFAPRGQGVVWGQTGLGPHAKDERHYIPSIEGYYQALNAYGKLLIAD